MAAGRKSRNRGGAVVSPAADLEGDQRRSIVTAGMYGVEKIVFSRTLRTHVGTTHGWGRTMFKCLQNRLASRLMETRRFGMGTYC